MESIHILEDRVVASPEGPTGILGYADCFVIHALLM